jgi:hypothetical protein
MRATIHPGNFECFMDVYAEQLKIARTTHPELYAWSLDEMPKVLERMRLAVARGSFNKDSQAIKATCKVLKIKHTYKDIEKFISL